MIPIQKLGMLMPKKPNTDPKLSIQEFGLAPAQTPSGTPMRTASSVAKNVSSSVAGKRWASNRYDRFLVAERLAEIALDRGDEKVQVLLVERLVEAPARPGLGDILMRRFLGQEDIGGDRRARAATGRKPTG